jgi:hypothetical protein
MRILFTMVVIAVAVAAASFAGASAESRQKRAAEDFIRGLYGCDPSVVDRLASDDIAVSYPVFITVFKKPAIRGKKEVKAFSERFCTRWTDSELTVDEAVEEGNTVVLLWSFKATSAVDAPGMPPKGTVDEWGGISLFRFDKNGKITVELGEESDPGPAARLASEH